MRRRRGHRRDRRERARARPVRARPARRARAAVTALLLEGGPHLAGAFLDAGEIDEARLFVAPMLLGGGGMDPAGEGVAKIADALRAIDPELRAASPTTSC